MCGRYTLSTPGDVLTEVFGLAETPQLAPRFNIAPTQDVPAVRISRAGEPRELVFLRWGLIPHWADDPAIGNRMINARSETVADKPAFRASLRRQRCLVIADGFYEWKKAGTRKQPFFLRLRSGQPFAFAGLWARWENPAAGDIESCTLLTTKANELVAAVHDRMPVILPADAYSLWLDPTETMSERLLPLFAPYPAAAMETFPVSLRVNSPVNDSPELIRPLAEA